MHVGAALLSTASLIVLFLFIEEAIGGKRIPILSLTGCLLAASVAQIVLIFVSTRVCYRAGFAMMFDFRLASAERLRQLPMGFILSRPQGELTESLIQDLRNIEPLTIHILPRAVGNIVLAGSVLGAVFILDPRVAILILAGMPLAIPLMVWSQQRLKRYAGARVAAQAEASSRLLEFALGISVAKAFRIASRRLRRLEHALAQSRRANIALISAVVPTGIGYVMCLEMGVGAVALVGALSAKAGTIMAPAVMLALIAAPRLYPPLQQLIEFSGHFRIAEAAARRLHTLLDAEPLVEPRSPLEPMDSSISFESVSFGYQNGLTLHGIDLHLPARSVTALTGPSGAGKTTIVNLIARLWDVSAGTVRIGSVDVRDISQENLNRMVTVVFQQTFLFEDTIMNNLRFGRAGASDADVVSAAKAAQCHDFISRLPLGYETIIGEGGATLSGGERQRLSIARAIVKSAPIVLLDEATASLDPENERAIQQALTLLTADKTVVIVAHRLAAVANADRIVVLDKGKVVGVGKHAELRQSCPLYQHLWFLQEGQ
jgi:ATP-binding cassette subfamily B protein